jgi:hypothetical protein
VKCFAIMPFAAEFDDVYTAMKEAAEVAAPEQDIQCLRLDELKGAGRITEDLAREIRESAICIADVTQNKANVLWEVGYAMALGKPMILVTQDVANLPFDIRDIRTIPYSRTSLAKTLRQPLKEAIMQTIARGNVGGPIPANTTQSFVPEFRDGMREIIRLLRETRRRLFVMCDFAGYAHFSELELFEEYWASLLDAIGRCNDVKILLYDTSLYRPARAKQFPNFERLRLGENYRRFCRHWNLPDFNDREEFLKQLDHMELQWRTELQKLGDVQTRSGPFWMFHWLNETNRVVYSIQPTHDPNDEMIFHADDIHLSTALRDQFLKKLWPNAQTDREG